MKEQLQAIVTVLSLVNPTICGMMFVQAEAGRSRGERLIDATKATLVANRIAWSDPIDEGLRCRYPSKAGVRSDGANGTWNAKRCRYLQRAFTSVCHIRLSS